LRVKRHYDFLLFDMVDLVSLTILYHISRRKSPIFFVLSPVISGLRYYTNDYLILISKGGIR